MNGPEDVKKAIEELYDHCQFKHLLPDFSIKIEHGWITVYLADIVIEEFIWCGKGIPSYMFNHNIAHIRPSKLGTFDSYKPLTISTANDVIIGSDVAKMLTGGLSYTRFTNHAYGVDLAEINARYAAIWQLPMPIAEEIWQYCLVVPTPID